MGVQSFIRWLLPREDKFYAFLEQQATTAHRGALALARFGSAEGGSAAEISAAVQILEHEGDSVVHAMEEALAKTFVTPIDREDLQRLSKELDDVLDLTNGAARAAVLYGVDKPSEAMTQLARLLVQCTEVLALAMPNLRKRAYKEMVEQTRQLRRLEKEADQIFRNAISQLFHDPNGNDAREIFRTKIVLDDLEMAVDYCEHVGSTLTHLAVKHG